ncbi:unnamed protein product [Phaeothamnion confervicola]
MGWLSGVLWSGGAILALFGVMLFVYQEKLLYFPDMPFRDPDDNPKGMRHPGEFGLPFEDVFMTTADGVRIHGWLLKQPQADMVATIVYFHGNAGNIGFRLPSAGEMYRKLGANVFLVEYRGYGKSRGTPSEHGLLLDALAALDALRGTGSGGSGGGGGCGGCGSGSIGRRGGGGGGGGGGLGVDPTQLIVFGRSLGGAVAIAAADAAPSKVAAVVVENTFLSVPHMVDVVMPLLRPLKPLVLRMKWPSDERMPRLVQPVLFVAGQLDELVPPWHMERLFELCAAPKRMLRVRRGTHNDTWLRAGDRYYEVMREFIAQTAVQRVATAESCIEGDAADGQLVVQPGDAGAVDAIPTMPKLGPTLPARPERRKED